MLGFWALRDWKFNEKLNEHQSLWKNRIMYPMSWILRIIKYKNQMEKINFKNIENSTKKTL